VYFFIRLFQLSKQGKLTVPAMNVNDSVTKVQYIYSLQSSRQAIVNLKHEVHSSQCSKQKPFSGELVGR
jgi:S-adenosylhomocysteine hydrolase